VSKHWRKQKHWPQIVKVISLPHPFF